jgi:hypothetical protein
LSSLILQQQIFTTETIRKYLPPRRKGAKFWESLFPNLVFHFAVAPWRLCARVLRSDLFIPPRRQARKVKDKKATCQFSLLNLAPSRLCGKIFLSGFGCVSRQGAKAQSLREHLEKQSSSISSYLASLRPFDVVQEYFAGENLSLAPQSKIENPKSVDGQGKGKRGAFPDLALNPDFSAMQLNELLGQR